MATTIRSDRLVAVGYLRAPAPRRKRRRLATAPPRALSISRRSPDPPHTPSPKLSLGGKEGRKPPARPRLLRRVRRRNGYRYRARPDQGPYWTAILNGLLAPFLLIGILIIACDRTIMQKQPSSMTSRIVVGVTALLMFGAAIGMFVL